jgi:uncharacterized membrane protein YgcG
MKNQMDLIISIVALILAAIIAFVWMETKRTVVHPAPPTAPVLTPVDYPAVGVQYSTSLPGGSGSGGMGGGGMAAGGAGGSGGFRGGGGGAFGRGGAPGGPRGGPIGH